MSGWLTPIRCYVSPAGNNKIEDWYVGLSTQEKADADTFLRLMRKTRDWQMPSYRPSLAGVKRIGELRWTSQKRQHRLLGFFGDGGVWYALVGCIHKQQVYDPRDALNTARKYKGQIEEGEVETVEYDL
jgi:hypothetical protein